eukprot:scaffold1172_cov177-Alexandrium_tamarense.AAC.1
MLGVGVAMTFILVWLLDLTHHTVTCASSFTLTIIGAVIGEESCNDNLACYRTSGAEIEDQSCNGEGACFLSPGIVVEEGSCNMSYEGDGSMCALASGALVGKESCLGGFGSCQGYISCYARVYYDEEAEGRYSDGPGGNIGDGSCNSIFSCGAFWGTVGNDSCNTFGVEELSEICTSLRKAGALPYTVDNAAAGVGATSRYELDNPYIGKKSSMQRRRHYELLASQVEMEGKERMDKLKKELEMRSVVLREQVSHGKKFLAASGGGRANATGSAGAAGGVGGVGGATRPMLPSHNKNVVSKNASNQFRSPLFTMTASGNMPSSNTSSLTTKTTSSAPSSVSNGPLAASATRTSRPPPASASITSSGYS